MAINTNLHFNLANMNKVFLILFLSLPLLSISQNLNKEEVIGTWGVVKSEFYLDDNLVRKVYVNENTNDTVIEGPRMGDGDEKFDQFVKMFQNSSLYFGKNDSFSWDITDETFRLTDKYWTVIPQTNTISVTEWKDKNTKKGKLAEFVVSSLENDKMVLYVNDSGVELKFYVVRKK